MRKSSRFTGVILALVGVLVLMSNLSKPRVEALRGADILGLIACGMCFGVAIVALLGRLRIRND